MISCFGVDYSPVIIYIKELYDFCERISNVFSHWIWINLLEFVASYQLAGQPTIVAFFFTDANIKTVTRSKEPEQIKNF